MARLLDNQTIDIDCPACGHKSRKTVGWLKAHRDFACACGQTIHIEADQFRREIAKVDKAVDDLLRKLDGFGKRR